MSDNIVTFGLKNVKYSKITIVDGSVTYGAVKELKGAQELTADISGGSSSVYGDDYSLATFNAYAGQTISLKMTEVSEDFKKDILGYQADSNDNLVEVASTAAVPFALGYEIDGDIKKRRMWVLFCTCQPLNEATKTKTDSVEANSTTLNITSYSIKKNEDLEIVKIIANETDDNYSDFLNNPPSLVFTKVVTYRYCPTDNINTDSFFQVTGSPSDVSDHTYGGKEYTKGLKLNSSAYLRFVAPNFKSAEMIMIGYANQTSSMPLPTLYISFSNQQRATEVSNWSLKDVEAMSIKTIRGLYANATTTLKKGTEIMLCDVTVTFVIEE